MVPRDDDPWRRLREREDEEEKDEGSLSLYQKRIQGSNIAAPPQPAQSSDKLQRLLDQAVSLMEEINAKYNMYLAGVDSLPPVERRRALERLMGEILASPKTTAGIQFKVGSVNSTYQIHKDKWDRMMRDLETGKIQRRRKG